MCGLNGILAYKNSAPLPDARELISTRDQMRLRGPDGEGEWWSEDRRLGQESAAIRNARDQPYADS